MGEATQTNRSGPTIIQLTEVAEMSAEARALLAPNQGPHEYLRVLLEKEEFADAVRFVAHTLPKREGVWWAWVCARRAAGEAPSPKAKAALEATETWIREPTDAHRRAAMQRAQEAEFATPAGCAGLAAFLSGDNLAPANVEQAVPPGEFAAAKAVAGAVILAAVAPDPEKAGEKFRAYLQQGVEVINRLKLWPDSKATS